MPNKISVKHIQISKANTVISVTLSIAAFLTVFSLVASKAMLDQRSYNSRVIKEKELAVKTLHENIEAVNKLEVAYRAFVAETPNLIDGSPSGAGELDGDNAKLILDALPSTYDFPAVATSLEKILTEKNFKITQITGIDDEVAQASKASENPEVVEIPFSFEISGGYDAMNDLLTRLEQSIRPIQIVDLKLRSSGSAVQLSIDGKTFYQSAKVFNTNKTKVIQ